MDLEKEVSKETLSGIFGKVHPFTSMVLIEVFGKLSDLPHYSPKLHYTQYQRVDLIKCKQCLIGKLAQTGH